MKLSIRATVGLVIVLASSAISTEARADDEPNPKPWDRLGNNIVDAFTGTNLFFHGGAVAITGIMAFSGADYGIRNFAQEDAYVEAYGKIVNVGGYILPVVAAPAVYVAGLIAHDREVTGAGCAAIQALAITAGTVGLLKWATGRVYPYDNRNDPRRFENPDTAHTFHPFNFKNDYAWPSGHTSSSISIAAALTAYYPEHLWIPFVGFPVSLIIGIGMIDGDYHWTSDVIAGALMGTAIGYSVGRNFRRMVRERATETGLGNLTLKPLAGATYGLALTGTF